MILTRKTEGSMQIRSQFIGRYSLLAGLVLATWAATPVCAQQDNSILATLLKKGVTFDQRGDRPLRPPTLGDGMSAAEQQAAIEGILALKLGQAVSFEKFARFEGTGLSAPYVMVIDEPKFGQNAPGHSIDLWFVVHGALSKVAAPAFLKNQFQPDPKDKLVTLANADLANRQIKLQPIPGATESYAYGQFRIFPTNTRVLVGGVCHLMQTTTKTSSVLAGIMDPRFDQDRAMPNQWQPVLGIANGQLQLGNPTVYHSSGGYTKISELVDVAGSLLVEYHFVFDEPEAWFNGNDLLRPKLQLQTPDDVRMFRRKVLLGK
jgi:hypothetical protein